MYLNFTKYHINSVLFLIHVRVVLLGFLYTKLFCLTPIKKHINYCENENVYENGKSPFRTMIDSGDILNKRILASSLSTYNLLHIRSLNYIAS